MSDLRGRDEVLRTVPEWQGATWTELKGGQTNRAWLLEKSGRKAVLKFDGQPREAPYNTRIEEGVIQAAAAKAGLAGAVLLAEQQIYLTEYIEGTIWNPACLDHEAKFEQLATALRRIHSLPRSGRPFDSLGAAIRYVETIEYPDENLVALCLGVVKNTRLPNYLCCCHNDLVAGNIITAPDLKFLDWEYACDNDPMFDLATLVEHHELNEGQARALLDAYFDGSGERWYPQLLEQQRLYLALSWLWLASRPERSNKALKQLAERLTTSCS
ncbi:MAG: phosphotransferase [Gammaproteobacteria bacterium]|nr:phosphotransferase [Gammaproteobacteria bacterium]NNC56358.1 phosphotransferase [Woeseiaceae bacterium]